MRSISAASPAGAGTIIFDATAAVLLGGPLLGGGIGGVGGTVVGVLFLGVLQNGLSLSGIASAWQQVISGAIVIFAVLGQQLQRGRRPTLGPRLLLARLGSRSDADGRGDAGADRER